MRRWEYIKTIRTLAEMAAYLEREIGDGVPVDFQEWLSELIEEDEA